MNNLLNLKGSYIQKMSDEEFFLFCSDNDDLKIERLSDRQIVIEKSRVGFDEHLKGTVVTQLINWNKERKLGTCLLSNSKFLLPDLSIRIATFAWISTNQLVSHVVNDRIDSQRCPDFIVEFKPKDDDLKTSKAKMKEWIANGCKLAWLIDEKKEVIYIFEKSKTRMQIGFDKKLSGEPVLPGFELDLTIRGTHQPRFP
jgi:Uma2 family endonuclease